MYPTNYFIMQIYVSLEVLGFDTICELIDHSVGPVIDDLSSFENFWQQVVIHRASAHSHHIYQEKGQITEAFIKHSSLNHENYTILSLLLNNGKVICSKLYGPVNATKMHPALEEFQHVNNIITNIRNGINKDLHDELQLTTEFILLDKTSNDPRLDLYNIAKVKPDESLKRFSEMKVDKTHETMFIRALPQKPKLSIVKSSKRKKNNKSNRRKK